MVSARPDGPDAELDDSQPEVVIERISCVEETSLLALFKNVRTQLKLERIPYQLLCGF